MWTSELAASQRPHLGATPEKSLRIPDGVTRLFRAMVSLVIRNIAIARKPRLKCVVHSAARRTISPGCQYPGDAAAQWHCLALLQTLMLF